jgi:tripeptide aminopeptidase
MTTTKRKAIPMTKELERFIRYVKIDTQSDDKSGSTPSAAKELNLSRELVKELGEMGIGATLDEYGRVYAKLVGEKDLPAIGLNSHVDTALEVSGANVKANYIPSYDGGTIKMKDGYSMSPADFPRLANYKGSGLVVTDGTTLLGGDDKAGVAIIMATLDHYASHPEEKHHTICVLFTPDEEIGRGPEHFDKKKFGADFAYTIDGADPDLVENENFNAAHADVEFAGVAIHPGEAKGKMVNALRLAAEFDGLLDPSERPELTAGYEGFNHPLQMEGTAEHASVRYLIRNHDAAVFAKQKREFVDATKEMNRRHPRAHVKVTIADDYRNMKEVFDRDPRAIKHADEVYEKLGIKARHEPIRGGTDGATFSFLGCPTPNLGTGSYNHHGRFEYLSEKDFETMIGIVIALVRA